jgi:hypothetical protein
VVEHLLAKEGVAGSNPVFRSTSIVGRAGPVRLERNPGKRMPQGRHAAPGKSGWKKPLCCLTIVHPHAILRLHYAGEATIPLNVSSHGGHAVPSSPPQRRRPSLARRLIIPLTFLLIAGLGAAAFFATRALTGEEGREVAAQPPSPDQLDIQAEGPDFSNKLLHWQVESYSFVDGSPDPANGRSILTDNWARIGPLNSPTAVRSVTRFEDGTFYQAELLLPEQGLWVSGKQAAPGLPSQLQGRVDECMAILNSAQSLAEMEGMRPFYVDSRKATNVGLQPADVALPIPLALKPDGIQARPETVIDATDLRWLAAELPVDDGVVHAMEAVDSETGLQSAERVELTSPDGTTLIQQEKRYSAIEVFPADATPPSLFDETSLPRGGCK